MKQFNICLGFFLTLFVLASCEKEHTGYLFTENARFPIDNLTLLRQESYQNAVNRLETQLGSYTGEIADSLATLQVLEEKENELMKEAHQQVVKKNQDKIASLCEEQGLENPISVKEELEKLKKQFGSDIPWTTSCIEQLLGTEPIIYTLESLRSDQGEEAAADFARYLTVIGGGRMYVDTKVNSPAGKYIVSLRVSNDGYSVVLPDIFTFILQ